MRVHESITADRVVDAANRYHATFDNPGFCTKCGTEVEGCEPDARGYECEQCGAHAVMGAEELLLHLV